MEVTHTNNIGTEELDQTKVLKLMENIVELLGSVDMTSKELVVVLSSVIGSVGTSLENLPKIPPYEAAWKRYESQHTLGNALMMLYHDMMSWIYQPETQEEQV